MSEIPLSAMDKLEAIWGRDWWEGGTSDVISAALDDMMGDIGEDRAINIVISIMEAIADEYGD
jgi:hypothetical protein